MGFLDVLAAGVRGLGDVAATATVVRSAERAQATAAQPAQPTKGRKLKPWEKFAGGSPCARGARSDEIQKAGSDFNEIDKALRKRSISAASGGSAPAPKARARVKVGRR